MFARARYTSLMNDTPAVNHDTTLEGLLAASRLTLPDAEHGWRCARVAGELFDALAEPLELGSGDRQLATLAALLHDVGHTRDAREHHRKSFDMIRAANLPGLAHAEREIVAAVARYHRKALPSIEHAGFGFMSAADQRRVRRLAALVRLAVALDASHLGVVDAIHIESEPEGRLRLIAHASSAAELERDRLRENAGAFAALTQLPIQTDIVWDDAPARHPPPRLSGPESG